MEKNDWKWGMAVLLAVLLLLPAAAMAEDQEILLPDGISRLSIPEEMLYQPPSGEETNLAAIYLMEPELEMLIFAYDAPDMTIQTLAETLVSVGREAQVREIAGVEFLVFQDQDEADSAPCLGYSYLSGGTMIEISFFYATQGAADLTKTIMESFHQ